MLTLHKGFWVRPEGAYELPRVYQTLNPVGRVGILTLSYTRSIFYKGQRIFETSLSQNFSRNLTSLVPNMSLILREQYWQSVVFLPKTL